MLLDCAADSQLHPMLQHHAERAQVRARSLFEHQRETEHAAVGSWLLEVPLQAHPEIMRWLAHVERSAPCLSWLASQAPFDTLYRHLAAQLDAPLSDGSLAMMRFWDPRVWYRFQRILSPDQLLSLFGPVLEWQVTLNGHPFHVRRDDLARHHQEQDADAAPFP